MVATAHWCATEAAARVLGEGGNAVDAAVTAAFALGVCEPQASGLGGQTMMLVHTAEPRRIFALDGSSRAPHRALPRSLRARERRRGHRATTVPSTPAVLDYALETYGTLPRERVLAPAIELAAAGYEVSALQAGLQRRELRSLRRHGGGALLLRDGTRAHRSGMLLRQPALAATLQRMARVGVGDFYTGEIARRIHDDMEAQGGLLRLDDLAQVPRPIERRPLATRFRNMRVVTFPEPGAGRVLIEMLHLMDEFPDKLWDADSPRGAVLLAEVMRRAALDRRDRPFDPAFYPQLEDKRMLSRDYARQVARRIRPGLRTRGETTHLSVMDRYGNAVGLTQSIEGVFGSCAATPELGFLYNNYMSGFEYEDITHPYYMRPNAVPWASVAPTLVFRGQRPWLVIGSPGSERIVTAVLQVLLRLQRQSDFDAVEAPRLHCSADGRVSLEAPRFRDDVERALHARGFEIDAREDYSFYMGCVALVQRERRGFSGVADPRRDGSAQGPPA
jgi:gamma-glutamyltranspeptidase/glutathione hydrolase